MEEEEGGDDDDDDDGGRQVLALFISLTMATTL
jgi:hypothetical protein